MTREEQEHYEKLAEHYNAKQKTDLDKNNMTREEAIKELQKSHDMMRSYAIDESESRLMTALNMAVKALEKEQKTGHWIALENRFELGDRVKCSECGQVFVVGDDVSRKYCPNCGAKMESEVSE